MVYVIIDRFEENWAVLDYQGCVFQVPRQMVPGEAGEGDVLQLCITLDKEATARRAERVKKLADEVFED